MSRSVCGRANWRLREGEQSEFDGCRLYSESWATRNACEEAREGSHDGLSHGNVWSDPRFLYPKFESIVPIIIVTWAVARNMGTLCIKVFVIPLLYDACHSWIVANFQGHLLAKFSSTSPQLQQIGNNGSPLCHMNHVNVGVISVMSVQYSKRFPAVLHGSWLVRISEVALICQVSTISIDPKKASFKPNPRCWLCYKTSPVSPMVPAHHARL